jgi:hypothetical protein
MVRFGERRVGKGWDFLQPDEREVCGRTRHLLRRGLLGVAAWPSSYLCCIGDHRSIEGGKISTAVVLTPTGAIAGKRAVSVRLEMLWAAGAFDRVVSCMLAHLLGSTVVWG